MKRATVCGFADLAIWPDVVRGVLRKPLMAMAVMVAVVMVTVGASAQPFSSIVVFGDSLSDPGNLFDLTGGTFPPSPPYDEGRFSNGPVWVERLASRMGFDPDSTLNFATGGATTGTTNINAAIAPDAPGLLTQIDAFAASGSPADQEALYVVWAGGNDFLGDVADPEAAVVTAVINIATAISTLAVLGAETILMPNLPDLGQIPEVRESGDPVLIGGASLLSAAFNDALAATLGDLEAMLGIDIIPLDVLALFAAFVADPAAFGLSNVTDRCLSADLTTICDAPDQHVFWDGLHPTAAGHAILAEAASAATAPPLTVARGDQSAAGPVNVAGTVQSLAVLQARLDTGPEMVSINRVMLDFMDQAGDETVVERMRVNLVNDVNGNGQFDADEEVLATQEITGSVVDTLTLELTPPLDILPSLTPKTTKLLVTLDINTEGIATARVFSSPLTRGLSTQMGWTVMLPSVLGLLLFRRLRRWSPRLYSGLLILVLGCSIVLTSCDGDDDTFTFTVAMPAEGMSGQGETSGPLAGPGAPIVGAMVTVSVSGWCC